MPESDDYETVGRESLTPERFERIRRIFEAALNHRPSERQAYLKDACAGDRQLVAEINGMLIAEERNGVIPDGNRPPSAPEEGRFPAGTVLAGRYRILGLLGKGGMGEVYKAFDLILNQAVALKFLIPGNFAEAALARFRNEVRIARQVSHPNVCRVYDVGMAEGLHFLSMEYIDGEDLDSLLRRIGRLPPGQGGRTHPENLRRALGRAREGSAASRSEALEHHDRRTGSAAHHGLWPGGACAGNPVERSA